MLVQSLLIGATAVLKPVPADSVTDVKQLSAAMCAILTAIVDKMALTDAHEQSLQQSLLLLMPQLDFLTDMQPVQVYFSSSSLVLCLA